jgi:hypothetical protein
MTDRCASSKQVVVGNNAVVIPEFEGTVNLRDKDDNKVKFAETLCIPGFVRNLVSLQMLLSKGCKVLSADEVSIVIRHPNGTEIPFTKNAGDKLYYLWAKRDESSTDSRTACALLAESGRRIRDLHVRSSLRVVLSPSIPTKLTA